MIKRVLNAPINLYFDKTPLSRIMSIFSKDLNQLEIQMTYHISTFTGTLYSLIGIAFLAVQAHYSMIILIPFVFIMCISLL
jgi:ABC-type multidrug transport system fused ATPase/permease subunit